MIVNVIHDEYNFLCMVSNSFCKIIKKEDLITFVEE